MDDDIQDKIELLSTTNWTSRRRFSNESRSASIFFPVSSTESNSAALSHVASRSTREDGDDNNEVKHKHLTKSGKLGMCNDPYCVTCPTAYNDNGQLLITRVSLGLDHNILPYAGARRQAREKLSILKKFTFGFGVMNPHAKFVQQWNKIIVLSCLLAMIIDPLFFFLLSVNKYNKCIVIDWPLTTTIMVFRSMTDFIYLMHMLVQFRLAFISPESGVVGPGKLVDDPKKVALHYLTGFFPLDLFIVIPLPQIIVLLILKDHVASSGANYAKNLLRAVVLVQYIPRLSRFLPLLAGQSPTGFIFESAWANFVINLLTFVLAGHVVGSCWYLFGLQRVNQCLRDACHNSRFNNCKKLIDCGHGSEFGSLAGNPEWNAWKENNNSAACFIKDGDFHYGIYAEAVNLTAENSTVTRYVYSFFWGFQQISTLAGNQVPSYFVWEVLFTMGIVGLGLLLFALLIGNMQNFLQGLGRRRLEMSLRRRDFEQWMKHRHLPEGLRSKVRDSERYNWAATQGVNEENLMEHLSEDLQRDIRRNLFNDFKYLKTVEIFSEMDEPIFDAIGERLRQTTYIKGGTIFYRGGFVTKMVFIVRGKMESTGEDGSRTTLSEGDVCGEELLGRCLELSSMNGDTRNQRNPGYILVSNRTVKCLTNVEAFVLRAVDLKEVTTLYAGFLRNHHPDQITTRDGSP